jgi:hypothetical protein
MRREIMAAARAIDESERHRLTGTQVDRRGPKAKTVNVDGHRGRLGRGGKSEWLHLNLLCVLGAAYITGGSNRLYRTYLE